jgi:MscS family membrane protein
MKPAGRDEGIPESVLEGTGTKKGRRPVRLRIPRWGLSKRVPADDAAEFRRDAKDDRLQPLRDLGGPNRRQPGDWLNAQTTLVDVEAVSPDVPPMTSHEDGAERNASLHGNELPDSLSPESAFEHPLRFDERIRALTAPVMGWIWYMLFSRNWSAFLSQLTLVVALLILLRYGVNRSLRWLYKRFQSVDPKGTTLPFEDSVFECMQRPLEIFAVTLVGTYMAEAVSRPLAATGIIKYLHPLRELGIIIATTTFLLRWVDKIRLRFLRAPDSQRRGIDQAQVDAVSRIASVATVIVALLISLDTFGVNIQAVLAFGGIGGVAIGFAGREVISNFFSGFMIYLTRPFTVGEWIRSINEDDPIDGFVEDIGWYLTRVRTWEKRPLYIPNSKFSTLIIENPSRMTNRRIKKSLHLRIEDMHVVKSVVDDIRTMLVSHPDLDPKQHRMVYVEGFTEFSCNLWLSCYTKQVFLESYMRTQQDIMLRIHEILRKHGARLATTLVRDLRDGTNPDIYGAAARLRSIGSENDSSSGVASVEYRLSDPGARPSESARERQGVAAAGTSSPGRGETSARTSISTTATVGGGGASSSTTNLEATNDRSISKTSRELGSSHDSKHGQGQETNVSAGAVTNSSSSLGSNGHGTGKTLGKRSETATPPGGEARPKNITTTQQGMILRGDSSTSSGYSAADEEDVIHNTRRLEDIGEKPSKSASTFGRSDTSGST